MKKIFMLIIVCFFLNGCYDNIELNNLNIIVGVGVDYKDDKYVVSFETINSTKAYDSISVKNNVISASGNTISEAFNNTSRKLEKKAFFSHLDLVIISNKVVNENLRELMEYLIRKNSIRDDFYLVTTYDDPKDVFTKGAKKEGVASMQIKNMLENSKYDNNAEIIEPFENIFSYATNGRQDIILSTIGISNDGLILNGASVYHKFNLITQLSIKETSLYNLIKSNTLETLFKKNYSNGLVTIAVNKAKIKYTIKDNSIYITGPVNGVVTDNTENINLKEVDSFKKLNKEFKIIIEKDINDFIKKLQSYNTDILGISDIYYQKYRKINNNIWRYYEIKTNINVKINKKGLIFEV